MASVVPAKWWLMSTSQVVKDKALTQTLLRKKKAKKDESSDDDYSDISSGDENDIENGSGGEGGENSGEKEKLKPKFWYVAIAAASSLGINGVLGYLVLAGATTFAAPAVLIPAIAGSIASVVSMFAVKRELDINGASSLRDAINQVRGQVNGLKKQTKRLAKSRKQMGKELKRLKECEENLQFAVEQNGASVDEFVELVEENQKIMNKMKGHFDAKVVQDCVRIIIKYDKDNDFMLSSKEMPMLIYALKSFDIQIESEAEFKQKLQNKSVSTAIQYVTDILEEQARKEAAADKYGLSKPEAMEKLRKIADDD